MTPLAAYILLFVAVGTGFIFVHLVAGKLLRPRRPHAEKGTIYECGEPTIGTAWVQFDLRFYVVALLFVIFDVEVAFFFPWAEVFGKANAVANAPEPRSAADFNDLGDKALDLAYPSDAAAGAANMARWKKMRAMTQEEYNAMTDDQRKALVAPAGRDPDARTDREAAHDLAWLALGEILVFFGVLLVGFAYLWRRGDLAWVRATEGRPQVVLAALQKIEDQGTSQVLESVVAGEHPGT